ncbi:hypothetical protein [Pseudonocardia ailaonensis]|uniref:hypothetical protein n=1 Tax=Pseudonocardia ailaonensis TaxID=367279 RepID=UPI0031DD5336
MGALGICIVYQVKRPVVTGVVLGGTSAEPAVEQVFELKSGSTAVAEQINDLVRALRSKLAGASIDRCVVKVADQSPKPSKLQAPRTRLMIEGALVFGCRDQGIVDIRIMNGRDIGLALGCSKDAAVKAGGDLAEKHAGACSAALAALGG